jgi:hypothetical protein
MVYTKYTDILNTEGGIRTHTALRPKDFKSSAATLTPPRQFITTNLTTGVSFVKWAVWDSNPGPVA